MKATSQSIDHQNHYFFRLSQIEQLEDNNLIKK